MAGKMINYLSSATADYNYTFSIEAQDVMEVSGDKKQIVHEFDDGSVSVVTKSDQSFFDVILKFDVLTPAEGNQIFALWHDADKANGRENTFYWQHPIELDTYVVRFMQLITRSNQHDRGLYSSISGIVLRVEGYKTT